MGRYKFASKCKADEAARPKELCKGNRDCKDDMRCSNLEMDGKDMGESTCVNREECGAEFKTKVGGEERRARIDCQGDEGDRGRDDGSVQLSLTAVATLFAIASYI